MADKALSQEAREFRKRQERARGEALRNRRREARENDSHLMRMARMFAGYLLFFAIISLPILYTALYRAVNG